MSKNTLGCDFKHPSGDALFVLEDMSSVKYSFSHDHEIQYTIYNVNEPVSVGSSSDFYLGLSCIFKTDAIDRFRLATLTDVLCDPNGFSTIDLATNKVEAHTYKEPSKKFLARIKKLVSFEFPLIERNKL